VRNVCHYPDVVDVTLWDDAFSWLDLTRGCLVGLTRIF